MNATEAGLDLSVMSALQTLDHLDNMTPAYLDGLDQSVSTVKDSDSAQRVAALNVSRMDTGKEKQAMDLLILMFISSSLGSPALNWFPVSFHEHYIIKFLINFFG